MISGHEMPVTVGHVGIEVSDLSRSCKFYQTLVNGLGLRIVVKTESVVGFANQSFEIWLSKSEGSQQPRVRRERPTGEEWVVADHLAILIQDNKAVEAVEKEMGKNGFEALFPCEEHPDFCPGYYAASFCDPDNYVIEIYSKPRNK